MDSSDDWLQSLRQERAGSQKDWRVALALSLLLGWFGADRFYVGTPGLGVLKLITAGGFGVWWVVDVALCLCERMKDGYGRRICRSERLSN